MQLIIWLLRWLGSVVTAPLWEWSLLCGLTFAIGVVVGSIIPWYIFAGNRFVQVSRCWVTLQMLEGGVILDGERAVSAATSFWQLGAAAVERFYR